MNEILIKAQQLIDESGIDENFFSKYSENLIATGERSVDYSAYYFEITDDYSLVIDFVDFSFDSFSIINKSQKELINNLYNEL